MCVSVLNGMSVFRSLLWRQLFPGPNGMCCHNYDLDPIAFVTDYAVHYRSNNVTIRTEADRIPGFERYGAILSESHHGFLRHILEQTVSQGNARTQRLQLEHVQKINWRSRIKESGSGADPAEPGHGTGPCETSPTHRGSPTSCTRAVSDLGAPTYHSFCPHVK